LALNQPTWQSSTYPSNAQSFRAVDGNTDTDWHNGSCAVTVVDSIPWFAVDIGIATYIYGINLFNRGDGNRGLFVVLKLASTSFVYEVAFRDFSFVQYRPI
jgi:hypothetical protein